VRWGIAVALLAATACARGRAQNTIAITHVSVIDVAAGTTRADNTVLVTGNRISYAGPAASATIPSGATVIDGRGKFLIPGLWDMHVHGFVYVFSDFAGPLMIANGVTGARDMGWYVDTARRWRADIAAGREVGPRLIIGARVDGPVNKAGFVAHVVTEEDGVRAVDTLARKKDGTPRADFIKTYSWIPRAAYFGIVREAKKLGVPFAGHVPYSVSVIEASDAGQRSIEHEDDLSRACTSDDSLLRARFGDTANATANQLKLIRTQARIIRDTFDPVQCKTVIATLARNSTWVTPTLVVYQPYAHAFDSVSTHPEWAKYVPGIVQGGWVNRARAVARADSDVVRSYFSFDRTRDLKNAGVRLLAGTDMPQPFVFPGFSLHEELELLVRSGLTPLEALRTATYNPAEFLGALDSLGTVTRGKVADLVLLDADPLADIRNTRRISVVIANGRLFDRASRAQLLKHVETANKR
jgi:cytosine/adenosine deaminase-related metal-dependent hydrolase